MEFAIVIGLLALVFSAIFDFGLAWRRSIEVSNTLRAGGRVLSNLGDHDLADYETLLALNAGIEEIGSADVRRVIIFDATGGANEPSAACRALPPMPNTAQGIAGVCNVYSPQQLAALPMARFTSSSATSCPDVGDWDRFYCAQQHRSVVQGNGLSAVGIWIEVDYDFVIGLAGLGPITMTDSVVHQLEPQGT